MYVGLANNLIQCPNNSRPSDPSCVLLPPHIKAPPAANFILRIASALATRFSVTIAVAKAFVKNAEIEQWGKVRRVDSSEGDIMRASAMGSTRDDSRDASHVRVCTNLYIQSVGITNPYCSTRCSWT